MNARVQKTRNWELKPQSEFFSETDWRECIDARAHLMQTSYSFKVQDEEFQRVSAELRRIEEGYHCVTPVAIVFEIAVAVAVIWSWATSSDQNVGVLVGTLLVGLYSGWIAGMLLGFIVYELFGWAFSKKVADKKSKLEIALARQKTQLAPLRQSRNDARTKLQSKFKSALSLHHDQLLYRQRTTSPSFPKNLGDFRELLDYAEYYLGTDRHLPRWWRSHVYDHARRLKELKKALGSEKGRRIVINRELGFSDGEPVARPSASQYANVHINTRIPASSTSDKSKPRRLSALAKLKSLTPLPDLARPKGVISPRPNEETTTKDEQPKGSDPITPSPYPSTKTRSGGSEEAAEETIAQQVEKLESSTYVAQPDDRSQGENDSSKERSPLGGASANYDSFPWRTTPKMDHQPAPISVPLEKPAARDLPTEPPVPRVIADALKQQQKAVDQTPSVSTNNLPARTATAPERQFMHGAKVVDWESIRSKNQATGLSGEEVVIALERRHLFQQGRADLADRVKHVSKDLGDGAGYDILSFFSDGNVKYIEVKTTSQGITEPFYLSRREHDLLRGQKDSAYIYRVSLKSNPPELRVFSAKEFLEIGELTPTQYLVKMPERKGQLQFEDL
jgi:hypothetical protein